MSTKATEVELDLSTPKPGVFTGVDSGQPAPPSQISRILELIDNPESIDLPEINRLIAREIAVTLSDPSTSWNTRTANEKIKALRELAKTLLEGDNLSKKDFLNFDGPKFRYVLGELVQVFRSSLKSSGQSDDTINHTLRIFRGQLAEREADLRKETERVNSDSLFDYPQAAPVEEKP